MSRDARLALVEHDREFADRKLHLAQQRDDSQARRIRESAENVDKLAHEQTYKAFFISGQPSAAPRFSAVRVAIVGGRSEEHTSELQSLMRISYAVFCLKKQQIDNEQHDIT